MTLARIFGAHSAILAGLCVSQLVAQSSVRCWGLECFDTEGRHGKFVWLDAGLQAAVVIRDDGRAFAQGSNFVNPVNPQWPGSLDFPLPPAGLRYLKACVAGQLSLALMSDGTVQGLGYLSLYPAGFVPPVPPAPAPGTHYVDIGAGANHGVLLQSDGVVVAFGDNSRGQTSVPTFPAGTVPVRVFARSSQSYALLSDGSLVGWGDNGTGLLNVPALPPGVGYTDLSGYQGHVVALRSDGTAMAWGDNRYGQCNVASLPPQTKYLAVSTGDAHSMAWRSDGVFVGWGDNSKGQLNAPPVPAGVSCVQLACGTLCSLARMSDGRVLAWGDNSQFQSQLPELHAAGIPSGARPTRFRCLAANWYHVASILSDGTLRLWGYDYQVPGLLAPPTGSDGKFARIAGGYGSNVGLLTDGSVLAWGTLVTGATVPPLPRGVHYVDVAMGHGDAVAIRSDGRAVSFGPNAWGAGNIPQPPPGVGYVRSAADYGKTLLLRTDGRVVGLGGIDPTVGNVPPLPAGMRYVQVSAPQFYNAALRSDGTIVYWGSYPGGDPNVSWGSWTAMAPLPFGVTYVEVSGRQDYLAARRSDGRVVVAGQNTYRAPYPPELDPGTSYVEVVVGLRWVAARVGPTSTYVTFTSGCAGSLPPTRLVPMDTPRIGHVLEVNLFDLPANAAFVVLGWQRIAPVSLSPFGMLGCDLQITIDDIALVAGQNGIATHRLPIPDDPAFLGTHFFHQALVLDPGAGNTFGAVVSNAAEGVVGDW